jgi:hypothetical protein
MLYYSGNTATLETGMRVLAMAVLLATASAAGAQSDDRQQQRADLAALATQLPAKHVAPFHRVSKPEFERAVAALGQRIEAGIDDDQAFAGMSRIVSLIGDGHTMLADPAGPPRLGLRFRPFGRDYRLVEAVAGSAGVAALGGRLISVGGVAVPGIETRLLPLTPADETRALRTMRVAGLLDRGMVLHGTGLSSARAAARFVLAMDDGRRVTIDAREIAETGARWARAAQGEPLSARAAGEPFACATAGAGTLYCNFRSYPGIDRAAAALFARIEREHVQRLVIDLRQNGGGDFCEGLAYLVKPLAGVAAVNRPGGLYVLIGPETFSAAMSNAAHFRQLTQAVLVGEPIGEVPNSYQEVSDFALPESGWRVRYSTRFYSFAPGGKNLIAPDRLVPETWADVRAGRDAALDWVLAQPMTSGAAPRAVLPPGAKAAEQATCRGMR